MSTERQSPVSAFAEQLSTDNLLGEHLPTERVLVDAHAHLHACFNIEKALQSAVANFRQWASMDEALYRDSLVRGVAEQGRVNIDTAAVQAADHDVPADEASAGCWTGCLMVSELSNAIPGRSVEALTARIG